MAQIIAFVLIVSEVAKEHDILETILKTPGVTEARLVFGEYDIIARIEAESMKHIDKALTKIRGTKGILRTVTLVSP